MRMVATYDAARFDAARMARLIDHFVTLCEAICLAPETAVVDLQLMDAGRGGPSARGSGGRRCRARDRRHGDGLDRGSGAALSGCAGGDRRGHSPHLCRPLGASGSGGGSTGTRRRGAGRCGGGADGAARGKRSGPARHHGNRCDLRADRSIRARRARRRDAGRRRCQGCRRRRRRGESAVARRVTLARADLLGHFPRVAWQYGSDRGCG